MTMITIKEFLKAPVFPSCAALSGSTVLYLRVLEVNEMINKEAFLKATYDHILLIDTLIHKLFINGNNASL